MPANLTVSATTFYLSVAGDAPSAPTVDLTNQVGGNVNPGVHGWGVSFFNASGETPMSAPVVGTADVLGPSWPFGERAGLTIPTGPVGTTMRLVYRTPADNLSDYRLVQIVADNTTTDIVDNVEDSERGAPPVSTLVTSTPFTLTSTDPSVEMSWSAVSDQSWLTISPASGTTPATTYLVADGTGLTAGVHTATVTITWTGDDGGSGSTPIPVTGVSVGSDPASGITWTRVATIPDRYAGCAIQGVTCLGDGQAVVSVEEVLSVTPGGTNENPVARIFRTFDNGLSWLETDTPIVSVYDINQSKMRPIAYEMPLMGMSVTQTPLGPYDPATSMVVRSRDGGLQWNSVVPEAVYDLFQEFGYQIFDFVPVTTSAAGTESVAGTSVDVTGSFGAVYLAAVAPSWYTSTSITAKSASSFTVTFGTAAPASATVDWTVVSTPKIYAIGTMSGEVNTYQYLTSTDGGQTFQDPQPIDPGDPTNSGYVLTCGVDCGDDVLLFGGAWSTIDKGTGTLWRSVDGGATFTNVFPAALMTDLAGMARVSGSGTSAVIVAGGRKSFKAAIIRSTDGGANWAAATFPAVNVDCDAVPDIVAVTDTYVVASFVTDTGGVSSVQNGARPFVLSTDAGATFTDLGNYVTGLESGVAYIPRQLAVMDDGSIVATVATTGDPYNEIWRGVIQGFTASGVCDAMAALSAPAAADAIVTTILDANNVAVNASFTNVPATVHDRAVVTAPTGVIPTGSSVTFRFYGAGECTGSYTAQIVPLTGGATSETVMSSAQTLTQPVTVSYQAVFNSGDEQLMASATSACEPLALQPECAVNPQRRVGTCIDDLTDNDIIRGSWQAGDRLIINRVIFSIDWDHINQRFTKHVIYTFDDSVKKYGLRPAMRIESKGIRSQPTTCNASSGGSTVVSCGLSILDERAANLGARFADPPPMLDLEIFYRQHIWEPGDIICVTSNFIPNIVTGRRELVHEAFECINIQQKFGHEGKMILTLLDVEAITFPADPSRTVAEDDADMLAISSGQDVVMAEAVLATTTTTRAPIGSDDWMLGKPKDLP